MPRRLEAGGSRQAGCLFLGVVIGCGCSLLAVSTSREAGIMPLAGAEAAAAGAPVAAAAPREQPGAAERGGAAPAHLPAGPRPRPRHASKKKKKKKRPCHADGPARPGAAGGGTCAAEALGEARPAAASLGQSVVDAFKFKGPKPRLLLKHLSKAGGTFSSWLAHAVVDKELIIATKGDDNPMERHHRCDAFTVLTLRNPCDWYVSWANGPAGKVWGYKQPTVGKNPFLPRGYLLSRLIRQAELRQFLHNSRSPEGTGFLTFYFWQQIVAPECFNYYLRRSRGECTPAASRCGNMSRLMQDMREADPRQLAHCYIFQETLLDDWRRCLEGFERLTPRARGKIDWKLFESIATNSTFMDDKFKNERHEQHSKGLSTQAKRRPKCSKHFDAEEDLEKAVRASDPFLFEKFGYESCCTPSNHRIW